MPVSSFGEYFVHNNNWNDNYGGDHTIVACEADNWYALVNVPNHDDNTVEAYLNVHKDYDDEPLANITSATFAAAGTALFVVVSGTSPSTSGWVMFSATS